MADILFVTWDGGGNVPPALGIARELQRRGHAVRFLGHAVPGGGAHRGRGSTFVPDRARPPLRRAQRLLAAHADGRRFGDRGMGRDLLDAVAARPPTWSSSTACMFGALDAAREAGLRYAVLEHLYDADYRSGMPRRPDGAQPAAAPARAPPGARRRAARLVTSAPRARPGRRRRQPASGRTGGRRRRPGRGGEPTVLVSLSTFGYPGMPVPAERRRRHRRPRRPGAWSPPGPRSTRTDLRARPTSRCTARAARRADAVGDVLVGHGGHGTTMQALAHDLPVLVVPLNSKRATSRRRAEPSRRPAPDGSCPRRRRPASSRRCIGALLADGPHRAAAARLGCRDPGHCRGASDRRRTAIEEALRDGAPAPGRPAARP